MAIKAVGTITNNLGDGRTVGVDWTAVDPPREWYFYTYLPTVWKVTPGSGAVPWANDGLIAFAFEDKPQDYDRFLAYAYVPVVRRPLLGLATDFDLVFCYLYNSEIELAPSE